MKKSRRDILKAFSLAGFGLIISNCTGDSLEQTIIEKAINPIIDKDSLALENAVDELEKTLKNENVIFLSKDHKDYENYRNGFNLNHQKHPQIIALCKNSKGVQEAIIYANRHQLKVAVKSGGHSFEGYSSINNGLQINLTLMNEVEWLEEDKIKTQPAVLLADLYDFMLPKNKIIPVGSCGTLGIGGLTLGGGYGFFAREHGLTCDSLIEATFVDGFGKKHITKNGDDLMWALKGGGNGNFGVVTEMIFKTYTTPKSFMRYRLQAYKLDNSRAKLIMQKWFTLSKELPNESFSAFVLNGSTVTILITNYGNDHPKIYKMADELGEIMDKKSVGNRKVLTDTLSTYFGTMYPIYFKNSSAGYYKDYSSIENFIDDILDIVLNHKLIYQINTLGGNISNAKFQSNSCYPHRNLPYLCELQSYWKKDYQKEDKETAFNQVQNILVKNGINKQYRNYPNKDFPNWEQAYYGENYKKLQTIKQKYDPNDLFSYAQSIKF
jgi:hypothetical protein